MSLNFTKKKKVPNYHRFQQDLISIYKVDKDSSFSLDPNSSFLSLTLYPNVFKLKIPSFNAKFSFYKRNFLGHLV